MLNNCKSLIFLSVKVEKLKEGLFWTLPAKDDLHKQRFMITTRMKAAALPNDGQ